jgi:hypothetical protein
MPNPQKYEEIILELFRRHYKLGLEAVYFSRDELREIAKKYGIRNVPDIIYYFTSGRGALPEEIRSKGFKALKIVKDGYVIIKEHQFIEVSQIEEEHVDLALPDVVKDFLREDEQAYLTLLRYGDVFSRFLGKKVYHLQAHLRSFGPYGEIEINDVYVTEDKELVIVEVRGLAEKIDRLKIERQVETARQLYPQAKAVIPLAVKVSGKNALDLIQLDEKDTSIVKRARRYILSLAPKLPPTQKELLEYML